MRLLLSDQTSIQYCSSALLCHELIELRHARGWNDAIWHVLSVLQKRVWSQRWIRIQLPSLSLDIWGSVTTGSMNAHIHGTSKAARKTDHTLTCKFTVSGSIYLKFNCIIQLLLRRSISALPIQRRCCTNSCQSIRGNPRHVFSRTKCFNSWMHVKTHSDGLDLFWVLTGFRCLQYEFLFSPEISRLGPLPVYKSIEVLAMALRMFAIGSLSNHPSGPWA